LRLNTQGTVLLFSHIATYAQCNYTA